jgi:hypothetical protein
MLQSPFFPRRSLQVGNDLFGITAICTTTMEIVFGNVAKLRNILLMQCVTNSVDRRRLHHLTGRMFFRKFVPFARKNAH